MSDQTVFSSHHFMFAFSWKQMRRNSVLSSYDFDKFTDLNNASSLILRNKKWKRYSTLDKSDYNEYTYFYAHVRKSIYDFGESTKSCSRFFKYDLSEVEKSKCNYQISYYKPKGDLENGAIKNHDNYTVENLNLEITGINLHLYNTGAGIISFDLINTLQIQNNKETILLINELGRRIYPQFLNFDEADPLFNAQRVFLSKHIMLFDDENWKDDFADYRSIPEINTGTSLIKLPKFIVKLFDNIPIEYSPKEVNWRDHLVINPITDDRMFFISWYGSDELSTSMSQSVFSQCDWWFSYIFGDKKPKSVANDEVQTEITKQHTYQRWSKYGTLLGMSRDSFVSLSGSDEYNYKNDLPPIRKHNDSIYYALVTLCLVQRISILNFSNEVTNLSDIAKAGGTKFRAEVKNLYANYIEFINKIYFREVTSQIQGIEIYQQMHKVMNIQAEVDGLDKEIEELHNYLSMEEQVNLGNIAAWFAPVSLFIGLMGMNIIEVSESKCNISNVVIYLFSTLAIFWSIWIIGKYKWFRFNEWLKNFN